MKTSANIQFTGPLHRVSARTFFDNLLSAAMEKFAGLIFHDDEQDYTLIEIQLAGAGDLKSQLNAMAQGLSQHTGWEFVGPRCKHFYEMEHKPQHSFMMNTFPRLAGETWSCLDASCRKNFGIYSENRDSYTLMTYKEFNLMMHSVNTRPEPRKLATDTLRDMTKPLTLGPTYRAINYMAQSQAAAEIEGIRYDKLRQLVKSSLSYQMSLPKIVTLTGVSAEEAAKIIKDLQKQWPGIADYLTKSGQVPIPPISEALAKDLDKLAAMDKSLAQELKAEGQAINIAKLQGEKIHELEEKVRNLDKQLDDWDAAILLPKALVKKANSLLGFLAGLNMQDHSIKDQRDFNFTFGELKRELERLVSEQFDGDKEKFHAWLRSDS